MNVGPYKLSSIQTGTIWLDGGAMFGTVPRVLWQPRHPPDSKHRIELAMRALLIEGEGRKILVDCGVGDKGGDKFRLAFNTHDRLNEALGEKGLSTTDMTDVILTHLHFDHAGGATRKRADGSYEATFPNATYYLQQKNLECAKSPNARERASYLRENFEPLVAEKRLKLLDGPQEIFPGISLFVSQGHTEAQQHPKVSDGVTTVFYGGDLFPTPTHVPLAWIMGYDLHPLTMLDEKRKVLESAVREQWALFYEHDPKIAATRIAETKGGYTAGEVISL